MTHYELYELFRDNIPSELLQNCKDSRITFEIMFIEIERKAMEKQKNTFFGKFLYKHGLL